jgi:hypothetical protein
MTNQSEVRLASDTIYYLLFIGIGLFLVWRLSDIIILMVTAMMCAAALTPPVDWLHKEKLPRPLAAALVVIALVLPIVYVFIAVAPTFITQLPTIMQTVSNSLNTYSFLPAELRNLNFAQYFQNNTNYLWESTSKVTNFFFQVFTLVVMIFYLLVDSASTQSQKSGNYYQRVRPDQRALYPRQLVNFCHLYDHNLFRPLALKNSLSRPPSHFCRHPRPPAYGRRHYRCDSGRRHRFHYFAAHRPPDYPALRSLSAN